MVAFTTIALVSSLAAAGASAYVQGQSAKGYTKRINSLRKKQQAEVERRGRELDTNTRKTSNEFKGEERTALTEKNDQKNRETLTNIHNDLQVGEKEGGEQKFKGKVSQGFKDKLSAERGTTKERSAALREAQAKFNAPIQAGQEEVQLLRNLGIDNNTIKSFMRGDQRAIDAEIAGTSPGGQGLITALDVFSKVAGAAALGSGLAAGGATGGASQVNPGTLSLGNTGNITTIPSTSLTNIGAAKGLELSPLMKALGLTSFLN